MICVKDVRATPAGCPAFRPGAMNDPIMFLDDAGSVKAAPAGIANLLRQNRAGVSGISPPPELVDGTALTCDVRPARRR
jgi:hypothetical protein